SVRLSALRSRKRMCATRVGQSQTGEKILSTSVLRTGLGSSFSPSVTANAAAVAPSRATTSRKGASREADAVRAKARAILRGVRSSHVRGLTPDMAARDRLVGCGDRLEPPAGA